ncbi:membrane-associated protein, putative [Bodo saltans]|uniref:Membrane-associated protein, putative n=1 Tax=Bodo saltans TaxID=75058 RepID=A0A0S4ITM4_BODSA|nr:membrane-associated protein, putative [Bodo saltans]|eukprot:CUF52198.1 membrane-associated protein, putative [Bodo saltans]
MTNGVPTFLDAPLQLSFGDEFGASQRGTVMGNLLVFIIVGIVSFAAAVVHRACRMGSKKPTPSFDKTLMLQSAAALRLPGATIVIVVLLLDSLVASSVLLVGYGTSASDIALGAFGLLVVAVLLIATCYILDPRPLAFQAIPVALEQITVSAELIRSHGMRTRIAALWDRFTTPGNKWEARTLRRKGNSLFVEHFGYLFEGCRGGRHWWIIVEATTTIVVSTLSCVVPDSEAACVTRAWIALALMILVFVACVAAWPMNTHIETGTAILLLCAQVIVVVCAIGGVGNVADIIGLSVSISSAAVALLPIAWWMISLLQTCWSWNEKKAPRDLLLDMRLRCLSPADLSASNNMLRRDSDTLPDKAMSIVWTRELVVTSESFRWSCGQQLVVTTSSDSLRVMIELICDTRRSK